MMKMYLFLLLILFFGYVDSRFWGNNNGISGSYKAAGLIIDAIRETETGTGSHFGNTPGTASDLYIKLKSGQVKTYEPKLFKRMRNNAGVEETTWLSCMNPNELEIINADSKSGQSFWRSKDGIIILKTIKQYECKNLREFLDNLANHLDVPYDHSCISGVLGAFRVTLNNGKKHYLLACKNVYPSIQWYNHTKYDLKGSTIGRLKSSQSYVLKDLDFIKSEQKLQLGKMKEIVLNTLERDAHFLSRCGFMDYSLLVDVEYVPSSMLRALTSRVFNPTTGAFRVKGKVVVVGSEGAIYHFGIIDFLQKYTWRKYLETLWKGLFYNTKEISCVEPKLYALRLVNFINKMSI